MSPLLCLPDDRSKCCTTDVVWLSAKYRRGYPDLPAQGFSTFWWQAAKQAAEATANLASCPEEKCWVSGTREMRELRGWPQESALEWDLDSQPCSSFFPHWSALLQPLGSSPLCLTLGIPVAHPPPHMVAVRPGTAFQRNMPKLFTAAQEKK